MLSFISMLISFLFGLALFILFRIFLISRPKVKGYMGERAVSSILSRLDRDKYMVLNNVMLKISDKTTQIDHIVVSNYGIFVIETKNYKGWIYGDEHSQHWTQVIYKRKEKLYNPIRQNLGHIKALKEHLKEFPNIPFYSIIVFTLNADLKVDTLTPVVYTTNLLKAILQFNREVISETMKKKIYNYLSTNNITSKEIRNKHVSFIQDSKAVHRQKASNNTCPRCNSSLVLRKGKFGEFNGCSNYPKCRYTLPL